MTLVETPEKELTSPDVPLRANDYRVTVIRDLNGFATVGQTWNRFIQEAGIDNLCLSYGWLKSWLEQFPPSELLILIVKDPTGRWLGVAPLKISKGKQGLAHKTLRHLQFIGTQPTVYDWVKIVTRPGEDEMAILSAMADTVRQSQWDVLDFHFMFEREQCERFGKLIQPELPENSISQKTCMPLLELPPTAPEYEKTRRKKTRLDVNRHSNRLVRDFDAHPQLKFLTASQIDDSVFTQFVDGHIQYWAARKQKSDFLRFPKLKTFYKNMLIFSESQAEPHEPKLVFSQMQINQRGMSSQLGFWQHRSYLSHITNYNQEFREYGPGTIHMDRLVFDALDKGAKRFDFGRGDEAYKRFWTKEKKPLWNLRLFRNTQSRLLWELDNQIKKLLGKPIS